LFIQSETATEALRDPMANTESEAVAHGGSSLPHALIPVKGFEELLTILWVNTRSLINDRYLKFVHFRSRVSQSFIYKYRDHIVGLRKFNRVLNEVY
jgi:hypothetical protein